MHLTPSIHSTRRYLYDLTIHGSLFLSSTPLNRRNPQIAYKDAAFLTKFYNRIKRNEEDQDLRMRGYEWISRCQGEDNFIRTDPNGSIIVFDDLINGNLTYAASSLSTKFNPEKLLVSPRTGYLFHPSPIPSTPSRDRQRRHGNDSNDSDPTTTVSPYGPYSLLRSSLVLDRFADSLELNHSDDDDKRGGRVGGGSYEYEGKRYEIGTLNEESDVWWRLDRFESSRSNVGDEGVE